MECFPLMNRTDKDRDTRCTFVDDSMSCVSNSLGGCFSIPQCWFGPAQMRIAIKLGRERGNFILLLYFFLSAL